MIPPDMLDGMSLGEPKGCLPYPYEPWKPSPTPLWPTEFKFDEKTKHPFNPSRESMGTVVKIDADVIVKVHENYWVIAGVDAGCYDEVVQERFKTGESFEWINYIPKSAEQVLTDLLKHGNVSVALEELEYCE